MCRVRNAHRKSQPVRSAHPTKYLGVVCVGRAMRTEKVNRCAVHTLQNTKFPAFYGLQTKLNKHARLSLAVRALPL